MDSLKELREWFLEDPETRAVAFRIADYYLVTYDDDPKAFRPIAKDDAFAKPVVEAFAGDSLGYVKWLRKLMSTYLHKGSAPSIIIGEVCKSAQSRGINRRKRLLETEALRNAVNRWLPHKLKYLNIRLSLRSHLLRLRCIRHQRAITLLIPVTLPTRVNISG